MQGHIFCNMDGMTAQNFLDVFRELRDKENLLVRDFCLDSYRWVLGEWVYHRMRDALVKYYGLDLAEKFIEYGKIVGIEFKVSGDIDPNSVQLEKKEPKTVYISTGGRGYGKSFMDDLMKHTNHEDFLDSMRYSVGFLHSKEDNMNYNIKDVIFSGPCTIVLWKDGTKTIVRCENEFFDREKGLAMAICKKVLGTNNSGSNYYDIFKKWCSEEEDAKTFMCGYDLSDNLPKESVVFTIEQVANKTGLSRTTINRRCLYKDYPNAKKIDGIWWIPEGDFQKDIKEGK